MNLVQTLRVEISRVAKKEARNQMQPLLKSLARQRVQIAALRRDLDALRRLGKPSKTSVRVTWLPKVDAGSVRFSRKGLVTLRKRLDLSADNFGRLIGCGGQSVYNYESGATEPRESTKVNIAAARKLSKKAAAEILATRAQ